MPQDPRTEILVEHALDRLFAGNDNVAIIHPTDALPAEAVVSAVEAFAAGRGVAVAVQVAPDNDVVYVTCADEDAA